MPKVSKATASSHQPVPGVLDAYSHEIDGWTISMETHLSDLDAAFLFKGAPNDQCQAPHMGYVLKGKYGMRIADGVEEVFEAGDAFFIGPGHTPIIFAGCEIVYFPHRRRGPRTPRRHGQPHEVHGRARDGSSGHTPAVTTVRQGLGATRVRVEFAEGFAPTNRDEHKRTSVLPPRPFSHK